MKIARDWNGPRSGGYVTRFAVQAAFFGAGYEVQEACWEAQREYWIPAEELPAFNAAIVGPIEVTPEFR